MANLTSSLVDSVRAQIDALVGPERSRLFRGWLDDLSALIVAKKTGFDRVLPLGEYVVDRWDKARALGFGEGTSIYDASVVLGDVRVGRNCWIGPFTVLDGSGGLTIGDNTTISAGAQVYSHESVGHSQDDAAPIERAPTTLGNRVYLGPNVVVALGVTIGDGAIVGANSFVNRDLPAGCRAAGNPARILSEK